MYSLKNGNTLAPCKLILAFTQGNLGILGETYEYGDVFLTPASQGARVGLFLLMPYNKCIGVIPIIGM